MPSERENNVAGIQHPQVIDGRTIWLDPEVEDIVHKLNHGDASLGWEGDERLALYRTSDHRWEVMRLEADGEYRSYCVSKPGAKLDNRLILELVAHDTRRGYNVHDSLSKHNRQVEADRDAEAEGKVREKLEKVYWALGRDIGHLY